MAISDKVFIDANIWLRYLVADQEEQFIQCRNLINTIQEGTIHAYTSSLVFLEVSYVLFSVYKISQKEIDKDITALLNLRGLVIVDMTQFRHAFSLHQKTGIKLADCLIATQVPAGVTLVTYDRDFSKLSGVTVRTPRQILA